MIYLIFWLMLCYLVSYVADKKGRSGVGFFFLAFLLSPLIGFVAVILVSDKNARKG